MYNSTLLIFSQGRHLLTAGSDYSVVDWDLSTFTPKKHHFNAPVSCAFFSRTGWIVACPLYQHPVLINPSGEIIEITGLPSGSAEIKTIYYACWAHEGDFLFLTGNKGQVHIIRDGHCIKTASTSSSTIKSAQISADGNFLLLNCADRVIRLVKLTRTGSDIDLQVLGMALFVLIVSSEIYGLCRESAVGLVCV
jgi:WD40 repeat protein